MTPLENNQRPMEETINQIRKWRCHFDGKDALTFLERINELKGSYEISDTHLLRGLPELFRGEPLMWYRNSRAAWNSWKDFEEDFRTTYIPPRLQAQLTRELRDRLQSPSEPAVKYVKAMRTLIRRAGGLTTTDEIERIYENLNPDYRLYVRWSDIKTIKDILRLSAEYEKIISPEIADLQDSQEP